MKNTPNIKYRDLFTKANKELSERDFTKWLCYAYGALSNGTPEANYDRIKRQYQHYANICSTCEGTGKGHYFFCGCLDCGGTGKADYWDNIHEHVEADEHQNSID